MPKNIVIYSDGTGQRGGLLSMNAGAIYTSCIAPRGAARIPRRPRRAARIFDPRAWTIPAALELHGLVAGFITSRAGQPASV